MDKSDYIHIAPRPAPRLPRLPLDYHSEHKLNGEVMLGAVVIAIAAALCVGFVIWFFRSH